MARLYMMPNVLIDVSIAIELEKSREINFRLKTKFIHISIVGSPKLNRP
ncbi:hypothetical protein [Coleofasciculus chthonoplastes]|nr:hypothetical protein [Coleofasciculus chthonoplastes]